jgi:DedD protein
MNARRSAVSRHEFRVGRRELTVFVAAVLVVWALTFVFGVLIGRELAAARTGKPPTASPVGLAERPPAPPEVAKRGERAATEEKLTFYRTLTAPTLDLPPPQSPKIEERIVPHEPPAKSVARAGPAVKPAAAPALAPKPVAAPGEHRATPGETGGTRDGAEPAGGAGRVWTVQVSSFRSRALAEELRGRLAAKGFDAYLMSVTTEDGRVRHRVRVGGFTTRAEAEHAAGELRAERNVNPFATTRAR